MTTNTIKDFHSNFRETIWSDGPGWSPDGGKFWIRGDYIYWHDGTVGELRACQGPLRVMPFPYSHSEDYSAWTDEHRAAVKKEWDEKRARWKREAAEAETVRQFHLANARAKLTTEEFNAVLEEGRY